MLYVTSYFRFDTKSKIVGQMLKGIFLKINLRSETFLFVIVYRKTKKNDFYSNCHVRQTIRNSIRFNLMISFQVSFNFIQIYSIIYLFCYFSRAQIEFRMRCKLEFAIQIFKEIFSFPFSVLFESINY